LYDIDRKYYKEIAIKEKFKSWEFDISSFIQNKSINYSNAEDIALEDTVFFEEVKAYKFYPGDVIADLGAGSGYFERVLSKYCDNLIVYATDIDSAIITRLITQLAFLELNDKMKMAYIPVLGNERASHLPFNTFDKVIIRNTFHHFSYPNDMLEDCRRIMKKGSKLFIVDILIDEINTVPACKLHLTRKVFLNYLKKNGFILINETKLKYDNFKCFEFQLLP
jgi:ubiquinone/menaquinone biosynthesis C-methylase UbiE